MPSKLHSVELSGLDGHLVEMETDIRRTLPAFVIVGLPDAAVQEAKERVKSALKNSNLSFPRGKVVVNLAPADLRKVGPRYDLPLAIGIAALEAEWNPQKLSESIFLGELALNGAVRGVGGVLASVETAQRLGFKAAFVPKENAQEAALVEGMRIVAVGHLKEAILHLEEKIFPLPIKPKAAVDDSPVDKVDMMSIKGQAQAKRALEIAAAGGHNVLMSGAPGAGKTLMAKALRGILPRMSFREQLEVTKVHSVAGLLKKGRPLICQRPFRVIHHTASAVSIVGGGNTPMPGEITLAHRGVLFLDEIAEFPPQVLEVLRQPLEDRQVTISRARASITYPAHFTLVAAMNPCPCGYLNSQGAKTCQCPAWKIERYAKKLSGPLLDRIDMHLSVQPVECHELMEAKDGKAPRGCASG